MNKFNTVKIWKIQSPSDKRLLLQQLDKKKEKGGTTLISYYRRDYGSVNVGKLQNEKAQAENIKDKKTSVIVQEGLDTLLNVLQYVKENISSKAPFVIFAKQKECIVVELPPSVAMNSYSCGKSFSVDPIRNHSAVVWGLVLVDTHGYIIAQLKDHNIDVLKESGVFDIPGKTRAGGQSSSRYRQTRQNLILSFVKELAEECNAHFPVNTITKFLVGGVIPTVDFLHRNKSFRPDILEIMSEPYNIQYPNKMGLQCLVSMVKDEYNEQIKIYFEDQNLYHQIQLQLGTLFYLNEVVLRDNYSVQTWYTSDCTLPRFYCKECRKITDSASSCEHNVQHLSNICTVKTFHEGTSYSTKFKRVFKQLYAITVLDL